MYAKLINGTLRRAPNKVMHSGRIIYNPPAELLGELGYLPVVYTDMPADAPDGSHYVPKWVQAEKEIRQEWELAEILIPEPELSADEALGIITGVM